MKVTRDVINDLLPVYLAGEASNDTKALVEEFLRNDPVLARSVETLRGNPLPEPSVELRPTREKETLIMTKRMLHLRGILMGLGIFLTMLPMSVAFTERINWVFMRDMPRIVTALVWLTALACWGGYFYVRRRLETKGF
jgi:hypothetical protein